MRSFISFAAVEGKAVKAVKRKKIFFRRGTLVGERDQDDVARHDAIVLDQVSHSVADCTRLACLEVKSLHWDLPLVAAHLSQGRPESPGHPRVQR